MSNNGIPIMLEVFLIILGGTGFVVGILKEINSFYVAGVIILTLGIVSAMVSKYYPLFKIKSEEPKKV